MHRGEKFDDDVHDSGDPDDADDAVADVGFTTGDDDDISFWRQVCLLHVTVSYLFALTLGSCDETALAVA